MIKIFKENTVMHGKKEKKYFNFVKIYEHFYLGMAGITIPPASSAGLEANALAVK